MTKIMVVKGDGQQGKAPFLRGILTRSLQNAGLSFDAAYAVASTIRDELSGTEEITSDELRETVIRHLTEDHGDAVLQRYVAPPKETRTILVRNADGSATAFSREQHRRHLESSGLDRASRDRRVGASQVDVLKDAALGIRLRETL